LVLLISTGAAPGLRCVRWAPRPRLLPGESSGGAPGARRAGPRGARGPPSRRGRRGRPRASGRCWPPAGLGDLGRFPRLESLLADAGIDSTVRASGEGTAAPAHLSKRGSSSLRRALWSAAVSASRSNPDLEADLRRPRAEGKPWEVALGAVAPAPAGSSPGARCSRRSTGPPRCADAPAGPCPPLAGPWFGFRATLSGAPAGGAA
jgi:hypothetical protein